MTSTSLLSPAHHTASPTAGGNFVQGATAHDHARVASIQLCDTSIELKTILKLTLYTQWYEYLYRFMFILIRMIRNLNSVPVNILIDYELIENLFS